MINNNEFLTNFENIIRTHDSQSQGSIPFILSTRRNMSFFTSKIF